MSTLPNINIPAGADVTLNGQIRSRTTDAPLDITGKTLKLTVKRHANDADADAVFSKSTTSGITLTDAANGAYSVTIDAADTVKFNKYNQPVVLQMDVYLKDTKAQQVYRGTLTLDGSVTHSP